MPWYAVIPAATSAIDAPTRKGGPSAAPVMLMRPASPWITASYPGRPPHGPSAP
jgi:hypothetical protein